MFVIGEFCGIKYYVPRYGEVACNDLSNEYPWTALIDVNPKDGTGEIVSEISPSDLVDRSCSLIGKSIAVVHKDGTFIRRIPAMLKEDDKFFVCSELE